MNELIKRARSFPRVPSPAPGAAPLQLPLALLALDQVAFAADDPQFVLVGGGQVDGPGGDGRAKVAGVRDVQVSVRVRPGITKIRHCLLNP